MYTLRARANCGTEQPGRQATKTHEDVLQSFPFTDLHLTCCHLHTACGMLLLDRNIFNFWLMESMYNVEKKKEEEEEDIMILPRHWNGVTDCSVGRS